jgi:hypothetical protein
LVQTDFKNQPVTLFTISNFLKNKKIWKKFVKKLHEILRLVVKKFFYINIIWMVKIQIYLNIGNRPTWPMTWGADILCGPFHSTVHL